MFLKKLIIKNYRDIEDIEISFIADGNKENRAIKIEDVYYHVLTIISSNYKQALNQLNDIFDFLTIITSPKLIMSGIKTFFTASSITIIIVEFLYNDISYRYVLKLNNKGVHTELLFANNHLKYNSMLKKNFTPILPDGISAFFSKIVYVNLKESSTMFGLVQNGIFKCTTEQPFLESVSKMLLNLGVTKKGLIVQQKSIKKNIEQVFIFDEIKDSYIDILTANNTIKSVFGFFSLLFAITPQKTILIIKDFGSIDLLKKVTLLKFFRNISIASSKSQLIGIDYIDNDSYELTTSTTDARIKLHSFVKTTDTDKYIFIKK